jgi:hypothetical protein
MEETMNNRAPGARIHHRRRTAVVGHTFKSSLWWPAGLFRAQIWENIRPTSQAASAQPAPVKKPTQNQMPIW